MSTTSNLVLIDFLVVNPWTILCFLVVRPWAILDLSDGRNDDVQFGGSV